MSGNSTSSTATDANGNYAFTGLAPGGNYIVTPIRSDLAPGAFGISAADTIAVNQHFLGQALPTCLQAAADVTADDTINVVDVIAIQRFFLGYTFATANVGKHRFTPASRSYSGVTADQTNQNFDALTLGDVVNPFAP